MRRTLVLGTAALVTTASLAVTVTGLASSPLTSAVSGSTGGFLAPAAAAAAELEPFDGCDELLDWYVEQALPEIGPWGFEGTWGWGFRDLVSAQRSSGVAELATPAADKAVGSSDTGTNVQEEGVDEPDRAKTADGLVLHVRGRELVVTDVTGDRPREVGTLLLPRTIGLPELLVDGTTVHVLGQDERGWGGPRPVDAGRLVTDSVMVVEQNTRLLTVSIADPSRPALESDRTYGGSLLSARLHEGAVRLAMSTGHPTLDFVTPNRNRSRAEATRENRQIVRDSTIADWLPTVATDDGDPEPLLDCTDVRHPQDAAGLGTISVVTFPSGDPDAASSTGVTTAGDLVYSSTERLYVGTSSDDGRTTGLHAFAVDGPATSYVGSGTVEGSVRDRWSIDEHDGSLRVAVAHLKRWETVDNGVTVLREQGDRLVTVGSVRGLGPDEEIKSVRWFDDLAVLVTFREIDPLYTVDLSGARPRKLGELKIPGFSQYLHPVGDDLLLGLGQDADRDGTTRGPQASLFDLGDLSSPERVAVLGLGEVGELAAAYDPRTFTWLPDAGVGVAALDSWERSGSSFVELRVGADGSLVEGRRIPLRPWTAYAARALPLDDGRVAVVDRGVRLVELG